jgi:hypothetical protein
VSRLEDPTVLQQASEDELGVDLTLIDWMLDLTSEQRLDALQSSINDLSRLRDAIESSSD